MKDQHEIDDLLRSKMGDLRMDYRPEYWDSFEKDLPKARSKKTIVFWTSTILVALASFTFWLVAPNAQNNPAPSQSAQTLKADSPTPPETAINQKQLAEEADKASIDDKTIKIASQKANSESRHSNSENRTVTSRKPLYAASPISLESNSRTPVETSFVKSVNSDTPAAYANESDSALNPNNFQIESLETMAFLFSSYSDGLKEEKLDYYNPSKKSTWSLLGGAHAAISSFSDSAVFENGLHLALKRSLLQNWGIQVGVEYSIWTEPLTQSSTSIEDFSYWDVSDNSYWQSNTYWQNVTDTTYYIGVPFLSDTNILVTDSNYIEDIDSSWVTQIDTTTVRASFTNTIKIIEVPILLDYTWRAQKWSINLGAGPVLRHVLSESIDNQDGELNVQKRKSFQFAYLVEGTVNYWITPKIAARTGLYYKGTLGNEYEPSMPVQTRLFGIRAGLTYRLRD